MSQKSQLLVATLRRHFGERLLSATELRHEVSIVVPAGSYLQTMRELHDRAEFDFCQLLDLCGVDYSAYAGGNITPAAQRFAVVSHLLSINHNWRLRVRVFADDPDLPALDSITSVWASANWYEREAFDLYGIVFPGHHDLRRILTDYGFIGHPFRKDFPISGHVEMRYDPEAGRVVYEPVSVAPRENTPRIVRGPGFGG